MPSSSSSSSCSTTNSESSDTSYDFEPRRFPPTDLEDVPVEYIIHRLRSLAPEYWNDVDTSDCTIIIPMSGLRHLPDEFAVPQPDIIIPDPRDPASLSRRVTEPCLHVAPSVTLKLHMDYLCAHSSFLRGLFGGSSPLNLISPKLPTSKSGIPPPYLLPSTQSHPKLFLPLPDPQSFHLLVHYMYFGDARRLERCLHDRVVQWSGLVANVAYLGMGAEIRKVLWKWHQKWLVPGKVFRNNSGTASDWEEGSCSSDDGYSEDASVSSADIECDDMRGRRESHGPRSR